MRKLVTANGPARAADVDVRDLYVTSGTLNRHRVRWQI